MTNIAIKDGAFRVVKDGVTRFDANDSHMLVLSRVVGTHVEPQRDGAMTPQLGNNFNIDETITIDTCDPRATHLIGRITKIQGAGDTFDNSIPPDKPYTFMGGTFIHVHQFQFFAAYTIFLENGNVRFRRRVVSSVSRPSSGTTFFGISGFTLNYALRAVRFL